IPQWLLPTSADREKLGRGERGRAARGGVSMPSAFQLQCHFVLIFLAASKGETRYLEVRDAGEDEPFLLLSEDLKRELSAGQIYRRSLRCIDMLSIEGQFTFTAEQPQLHCATFFIGEPEELITIDYDFVNIDCQGGDFLKVFDGWILKGEKFPSSFDHPLPTSQRYVDFCESGNIQRSIRSSQNVAMIFFRIHQPGNGFTVTVKKNINLFRKSAFYTIRGACVW
ncbi:CRHBP protein, partial [Phaetusa simplex]|nr:CRHBP protein [Phaetusa simplex]